MKADDILALLATRHSKDVFVPECKDGPTLYGNHSRMDAWVMRSSWSKPCLTAYEVKVTRHDFLKDDKWHTYVDLCNEFYFVCPPKLIAPTELPDHVGLIWVSSTGTRLYTKKKAPRREIEPPVEVFQYILMCRARITREHVERDKMEYWREWLEQKRERREIGHRVSKELARKYREDVERVRTENARLAARIEHIERVEALCKEYGIALNSWGTQLERQVKALSEIIPPKARREIDQAVDALTRVQARLNGES